MERIVQDRNIFPNSGQFGVTYPQSKNSYAFRLPAVAIFDFDPSQIKEFMQLSSNWESVLLGKLPGVVIGIDRELLDPGKLLLPREIANKDERLSVLGITQGLTIIPSVEALYAGPIPVNTFTSYVLVGSKDAGGLRWHCEAPGSEGLRALLDCASAWQLEVDHQRAARHAKNDFTLAEIVDASFKT
ncbi:MAG TPA: hypothetical protein VII56_06245 [Rhizomicrobium sp.]